MVQMEIAHPTDYQPSRSAKGVHKRPNGEMQELSRAIGIQILKFVKTGIYYFDYHTSGKNVTSQNTVLKMHQNF